MVVRKTKKIAINKNRSVHNEVEVPISKNPEIQDGVNPRGKLGGTLPHKTATLGLSVGATLNMGDFQSARIDVFIQRNVPDTEEDIVAGLEEISDLLHTEVERQSSILMDD